MKKVFDNHMVAHVWAQQSQQEGRSANGNFSFHGDTLYSYRTPIARIVETPSGAKVALVTSHSYSVTTNGKHLGPARNAARHLPSFRVPFLGITGGMDRGPRELGDYHAKNLESMVKAYGELKETLRRKRDLWQALDTSLEHAAKPAFDYAETFALPTPALPWVTDAQEIYEYRAARDARNNTPAKLAAKERAQERKRAKVRDAYRSGASIREITGGYNYAAQRRLEALMTAEDNDARAEALRVINADKIGAWMAGAPISIRFDAACGGAALRIRGDQLETSHGASVPLAHAVKAFRFLKLCKERGQGWHHNGHSIRVGHFTVDSIAPDGSFKAGCHDIRWPEVERVARLAGVFDAASDDAALTPSQHAA